METGLVASVQYKGQLHLGYAETENDSRKRLGTSINLYRNRLAQFIMKLFRLAIIIHVDGKDRCVNKANFLDHLKSIGIENPTIQKTGKIIYDRLIAESKDKLQTGSDNLGALLPQKQRLKYTEKMIEALWQNNSEAVKRYLNKGAYVDHEFFIPVDGSTHGKTMWLSRASIEKHLYDEFLHAHYSAFTPLSYAVEKGNQVSARILHNFKGEAGDKKVTFELFAIRNKTKWETCVKKEEEVRLQNDEFKLEVKQN